MKLNKTHKKIVSALVYGCLLSSTSVVFAGEAAMPASVAPVATDTSQNFYVGVFGGEAKMNSLDFSQLGTAYFTEAEGGPLSVNASGDSKSDSTSMYGAHIGFIWPHDHVDGSFSISPAIELEGYTMDDIKIEGDAINNTNPMRLPEHDFYDSYPIKSNVFLVNAVFNVNYYEKFTPYVGIGIGSGVESISNATSTQVDPPEENINHYNSDGDSTAVAFAVQPKIGARFNLTDHIHIFAEYRYLYLSDTSYTFGSTVYPTHAETSPWDTKIDSQHYNMGVIGAELSF